MVSPGVCLGYADALQEGISAVITGRGGVMSNSSVTGLLGNSLAAAFPTSPGPTLVDIFSHPKVSNLGHSVQCSAADSSWQQCPCRVRQKNTQKNKKPCPS